MNTEAGRGCSVDGSLRLPCSDSSMEVVVTAASVTQGLIASAPGELWWDFAVGPRCSHGNMQFVPEYKHR
ncbi:hypothetical protein KC325_g28 [Hortaea werneckii]|nr:hypothetical protein KC325_g28 [Hortaea werneckii]